MEQQPTIVIEVGVGEAVTVDVKAANGSVTAVDLAGRVITLGLVLAAVGRRRQTAHVARSLAGITGLRR
jgi:hypothetical protein